MESGEQPQRSVEPPATKGRTATPWAILPRPEQAVVNFVPRAELEACPRKIKKVIAAANNHFRGQAAANAVDLKRLLRN
jgi:hypothetical protein